MGKLGQKITTNAATLGHHAGRHWGYLKKTLGQGSSAINMAQGLTAAVGYATGKDLSGTTAMLNSAGKLVDETQQGMSHSWKAMKKVHYTPGKVNPPMGQTDSFFYPNWSWIPFSLIYQPNALT